MIGTLRPIATPRMRVLRSSATMVEGFLMNVAKERIMHLRFVPRRGRRGSALTAGLFNPCESRFPVTE